LTDSEVLRRAQAVRHFNRFYTRHIGALHERLQKSAFSLTEVRVLNELSRGEAETAAALARNLGLDTGYLSRLLTSFERRDLISRRPSDVDARQSLLSLTDTGRETFEPLDAAANDEVSTALRRLDPASQEQLIAAMRVVERLLDAGHRRDVAIALRAPRAGELSWLAHRQAQLFGGDEDRDHRFEARLVQRLADFMLNRDPSREKGWIAELDGAIVGSALVTRESATLANVQLLYVEPDMRRHGIGAQLLDACVRFATGASFAKLALSIEAGQADARRLSGRHGFSCVGAIPEERCGTGVVVERWERAL